jgi:hypothetical protein
MRRASELTKQKRTLKDKKNGKFHNIGSADENKKISIQQFLSPSEAEIQALIHPAEANLGYFLAWFQSLQLPCTQSESPLAPKCPCVF